jgi:hypothetical protein
MKIWIDNKNPAPKDFKWCKTLNEAKKLINEANFRDFQKQRIIEKNKNNNKKISNNWKIEEISCHFYEYSHLIKWLRDTNRKYYVQEHI